ncbi:MAG TPA: 4-(cytidine 5'-diphospho)-2-C-methyl-D-erythritol kinase [Thermoleophilaceae bacterium]|nr:4-(cytidine 5'-diphospho)-2-C-methyl-D-erythritol kinase [Thermoleophilaceae bacterium]
MLFHEQAPAKLNLVLHVGPPRPDGLHPLCSLIASIDLADEVQAEEAASGEDTVDCPGVEGRNLALTAIEEFRRQVHPGLSPVAVRIAKRVPVAAGLGGGSADAAAVLRIVNRMAGDALDASGLRELGAELGSDVPSQIEPGHALVQGAGETVDPLELPPLWALVVPEAEGLSTAAVYAELDRLGGWRERLEPERLRALARDAVSDPARLPSALDNDLQPAALSLRPELARTLERLDAAGALGAAVTGSGPTCFGLFCGSGPAVEAAASFPGSVVAPFRQAAAPG